MQVQAQLDELRRQVKQEEKEAARIQSQEATGADFGPADRGQLEELESLQRALAAELHAAQQQEAADAATSTARQRMDSGTYRIRKLSMSMEPEPDEDDGDHKRHSNGTGRGDGIGNGSGYGLQRAPSVRSPPPATAPGPSAWSEGLMPNGMATAPESAMRPASKSRTRRASISEKRGDSLSPTMMNSLPTTLPPATMQAKMPMPAAAVANGKGPWRPPIERHASIDRKSMDRPRPSMDSERHGASSRTSMDKKKTGGGNSMMSMMNPVATHGGPPKSSAHGSTRGSIDGGRRASMDKKKNNNSMMSMMNPVATHGAPSKKSIDSRKSMESNGGKSGRRSSISDSSKCASCKVEAAIPGEKLCKLCK